MGEQAALLDRYRGCLIGLAAGDALGTTVEFCSPGTFEPVRDMVGGGPFDLKPGQWTDDTSMALCLSESLVECRMFHPLDQMKRYVRWYREGHLSSTGICFDIGNTVRTALERFEGTGEPFSGAIGRMTAGNGSIMRLAAVPLAFASSPREAIIRSGDSSLTTHGAIVAVDACRYLGGLIVGALSGASKEQLLSPGYSPAAGFWQAAPLVPEIAEIAGGSYKHRQPPDIAGTGYAAKSLEAALWAFHHSDNFKEGALAAVNLGDDADTTAAVYGQLAGAYYGVNSIPEEWRVQLCRLDLLEQRAKELYEMAWGGRGHD